MSARLIFLTFFVFLGCSCGKTVTERNPVSNAENDNPLTNPEANQNALLIYESFPAPGLSVVFNNFVGVTTEQRQLGNEFCRKTGAVVPNAVFSYQCWRKHTSNAQASSNYYSISAQAYSVMISGLTGVTIAEKINSATTLLCQKSTPVYPGAQSSFYCYSRL